MASVQQVLLPFFNLIYLLIFELIKQFHYILVFFLCHQSIYLPQDISNFIKLPHYLEQVIRWMWCTKIVCRTVQGVSIPCAPLHGITGQYHTPNLYIFMTTHQFQINMQIFRASMLFTCIRSHDLSFKVEHIFVTNFCFIFQGCFRKMVLNRQL